MLLYFAFWEKLLYRLDCFKGNENREIKLRFGETFLFKEQKPRSFTEFL